MLADVYYDTYKQYKRGTKQVVRFLAATTGYTPKSGKNKSDLVSQAIRVPVDVLPQLAKKIAESKGHPPVPREILQALEWVITARRECATAHQLEAARNGASKSDRGHQHILGVLKRVLQTLRGISPGNGTSKVQEGCVSRAETSADQQEKSTRPKNNRFVHLDLQEPIDSSGDGDERSSTIEPDASTGATQYEFAKSDQDSLEETIFAASCFLQDFDRIRQYVRALWTDYRDGKTSLKVAAITTNVAIDTIERLHKALTEAFPRCRTYEELYDLILNDPNVGDLTPASLHADMRILRRGQTEVQENGVAHLLPGREVYTILKDLSEGHRLGKFLDFHWKDNGFDWVHDCTDGATARTTPTIIRLLLRLIPDMVLFSVEYYLRFTDKSNPLDQLTSHIAEYYETQKISIPLIFACEIFLDIIFELRSDISRPWDELRDCGIRAQAALKTHYFHTKALADERAGPETLKRCHHMEVFIDDAVRKDMVTAHRWKMDNRPVMDGLTPFCLLKHHPVLCGVLAFNIDQSMYQIGLCLSNDWMCLMSVMHLYNAARQAGYLRKEWPDLEAIIEFYGPAHIFIGDRATSAGMFLHPLWRALGISASTVAAEFRKKEQSKGKGFKTRQKSGRVLHPKTLMLEVMRTRHTGKKEPETVLREVEQVVKAISGASSAATEDVGRIVQQWNDHQLLAPLDLLELVRRGIESEAFQSHFDFWAINRRCIELLRRLRDYIQEVCPDRLLVGPCEHNFNLYAIPQVVLFYEDTTFKSVRVPDLTNKATCEDVSEDISLLEKAAERIDVLIDREGAKEIEKAKKLCSASTYNTFDLTAQDQT
ncbi:hypothetical protein LTR09_011159 [Extremus antarcticus]|uniref:DUF6604 domain-containing protein n=1 Tax=Extremus antarcticus TaxID=702011 RepID=A0AAJ0GAL1_9PEZI|nr:hypothetical protein LTR09_011159 [Extremus antarcticus]